MKIIGMMNVHNGANFIEYSIRSIMSVVDKLIVIEGAWQTGIRVNGEARSTDGTIPIIRRLQKEYNIELYFHNEENQLKQRNKALEYLEGPCWAILWDHDEVIDEENGAKIRRYCKELENSDVGTIQIKSLTFFNDFQHYSPITFPRIFAIRSHYPDRTHHFVAPNSVFPCNKLSLNLENEIEYFHYSYVQDKKRFVQKRRERIAVHGDFKWKIDDQGRVYTENWKPKCTFDGDHPEVIRDYIEMLEDETRR